MGDHYIALLGIVLLGYALMGKGFAYLGFPPLYVGEIALLAGMVVFLRTGAFMGSLATLPAVLLVVLMVWVLARTMPFVGVYKFDALRDSVIIMYGCFAFIVIGLLLEDARRIDTILRYYGIMLWSFPAIPVGFWLTKYWGDYIPHLFGPVPIVEIGASAVGTHLAGTMIYILIGYRKTSVAWIAVWFITLALVGATNRGATLAVVMPLTFAILMLGRFRLMFTIVVAAVCIFMVLFCRRVKRRRIRRGQGLARPARQRPPDPRECQEHHRSIRAADGRNQTVAFELVGHHHQRHHLRTQFLDRQRLRVKSR